MKAVADHFPLIDSVKRFFYVGGDVALICNEPEKTLDLLDKLSVELTDRNASEETKQIIRLLEQSKKRLAVWKPSSTHPDS